MKLLICVMPLLAIFAVFEVVLVFALMKAAGNADKNADKQDELILVCKLSLAEWLRDHRK